MKTIKSPLYLKIISFIILWFVFGTIKYNDDWIAYETLFTEGTSYREGFDFLFMYLVSKFNQLNLEYEVLYQLHIVLISIFYISFFGKFVGKKLLYVIFPLILIYFVPLSCQIRYYLAFSIAINSFYYLYKGRLVKAGVFFLFAFLSHSGILFLGVCFAFFVYLKKYIKINTSLIVTMSLLVYIFYALIASILIAQSARFSDYSDQQSSLLGGVYVVSMILIFYIKIFLATRYIKKHKIVINDDCKFLLLLSIASVIFLLPGMEIHILYHRYIGILIPIWICLFISLKANSYVTSLSYFFFIAIVFLQLLYQYVLPTFIMGDNETIVKAALMIESMSL